MLERLAAAERESAADYAAIAKCSINESEFEATALNYATTLVSVAKHFNSFTPNTIGLSNGSILESRIRRLLAHSSKPTRLRLCLASIIFVCSLLGLFFIPVAFQPKELKIQAEAAVINNQKPDEKPNGNENLSDLSIANQQNKLPQIINNNESKETVIKAIVSNQDRNEQEKFSNELKGAVQTPQTSNQIPKRIESLNDGADDNAENLMRQLGEEDARASGIQQEMDELQDKIQSLDDSRKNLGSNLDRQARQRAASRTDSMRQNQLVTDLNQKLN